MLSELADPEHAPEVLTLREQVRSWGFYDSFRSDALAPALLSQLGTRTPVLSADGSDLAAALQTIVEDGGENVLAEMIDRVFPGSRRHVVTESGRFSVALHQPGLLRPLSSDELSDGTLRYMLLTAALLSARPPALLVLNEPETSLHPDLLAPLAHLISAAADRTQVVVVIHARALIDHLRIEHSASNDQLQVVELVKHAGETKIDGQTAFGEPQWTWPKR
jgi:predicted ATPase